MLLLSKVDVNLLEFDKRTLSKNIVNLYFNDETLSETSIDYQRGDSDYSNTFELSNNEYLSYHFSMDFSVLTLYTIGSITNGKTVNLFLPNPTLNKNYTFTIQEIDTKLAINMILRDGVVLSIALPIDFLHSDNESLGENWFNILNPYDFTVRVPHLLCAVSAEFFIVFLEDGGLLGLRKCENSYLEPILFNDNSYLQSITQIFTRKQSTKCERAISCVVYLQKFLIVLTQHCHLKFWNLQDFSLVLEVNLAESNYFENAVNRTYEAPGEYMTMFSNFLTIYLPFGNGIFQIAELSVDGKGKIIFNRKSVIPTNLSSSSIWSLVDLAMLKPLDFNLSSSYLNIAVLWKSGCISKLQVLNLSDEDMQAHEWIESTNRSLSDMEAEQDLKVNGDTEKGYLNLKTRYSEEAFKQAHKVLSENNIIILAGEPCTMDYLANLETVLRDLKNKSDEVSSLTIYRNEIIVTNCLRRYNYSVFAINSTLENVYYNIHNEYNEDDLTRYLKSLHGFSTTLSRQVLSNVAEKFIAIVSGEISKSQTLNEKFTSIFKSDLESNFEVSNLKLLFGALSSLDIIALLNDLIYNHINDLTAHANDFIVSIIRDGFSSVVIMESFYQVIFIQRHFVFQVLLTFAFLDFDSTSFSNQLNILLDLHFKQSLILSLYRIDKCLLIEDVFAKTTRPKLGIQLGSYSQWRNFLACCLSNIYDSSLAMNFYFMRFFDTHVCRYQTIDDQRRFKSKLLMDIGWSFYIRDDQVEELMLAMMFFVCDQYERAYEFFQLHDYAVSIAESLPLCISDLANRPANNIWKPLVSSFKVPYRHSSYYYELSVLFFRGNSVDYAFKCIKKSIEYSMKNVDIIEPVEFRQYQLKLYLDLLFHFSLFAEGLDVLRFNHDTLSDDIRKNYFEKVLQSTGQSDTFFATLLKLCHSHNNSLYLSISDYKIIKSILASQLQDNNWTNLKKLYCFHVVNNHERAAAELMYHYSRLNPKDSELKRRCFLIVINVLCTFDDERDRWILNGSEILKISDLKKELENI
ncbi:hypothetical protein HG535_0C05390 [Zygotorulaspora mrakii]|uniref:Uncharacterized protein n=1 Tax=Zygotorulaspora mrakii TaxID=42260 RepID=A0A7H9B0H5_ZYGMR|nr:uncharacterized protein HG535_0C05390 [Zygotorulaspora mrakii]QLG72185.1 hypothetical protein HG535_0C05390 [Zygotorulaspora mrakii]